MARISYNEYIINTKINNNINYAVDNLTSIINTCNGLSVPSNLEHANEIINLSGDFSSYKNELIAVENKLNNLMGMINTAKSDIMLKIDDLPKDIY